MSKVGKITEVDPGIYFMDSQGLGPMDLSGVYIVVADGLTLVETGGGLTIPHILESVQEIGYQEKDIRRSIVTHVHLDHAGGAGSLVKRLPWVRVYVHERGARHLLDPSKLMKSAEMVYGSRKKVLDLHGDIIPVPKENLSSVSDTDLSIGADATLKIFSAPGHAPHHLCVFEPRTRCLFSGEALGHYYPKSDMLTPAVAPPGFNLVATKESIRKIQEFKPKTICFSQYGPHRDADFVIAESIRLLEFHDNLISDMLKLKLRPEEIIREMMRGTVEEHWGGKQSAHSMLTSLVLGFVGYYQRLNKAKT
jgi:glyoxylase-like metal-dependent hydrolase (beta-lactamase superfamily II)